MVCDVWCMMCDVWCMMCVGWCVMCVMCVVLCCVVVLCGVWCAVVFCSFLPFAQAVCYSKREPNIKEYWEKQEKMMEHLRKARKR